ncbi:MAG: glutamate racemase [Coriobacteriales bacterium]|nr:glutamate racemase [Coriobacteriales bacterium]
MAERAESLGSEGFVGVFDSGVGGISVLQHLVRELPAEDFRFFGDSAHAPYGGKTPEEVYQLSEDIASRMIDDGAKALVIACNTATSAAATQLRTHYPELPIVGVEPALKPAVLAPGAGKVLVMATEVTLALDKFQRLAERWAEGVGIETVACTGLVEFVERGELEGPHIAALLEGLVGRYRGEVDRVVLGCTHYPFVRAQIGKVLGDVRFFDGGAGTARQLRRLLAQDGLLRDADHKGSVTFSSSIDTPEERALYQRLFDTPC